MCSLSRGKTWKMISSAYTVIFSFSNADKRFAEKGFYTYFATKNCHFALCTKLKVKLFFIYHFWRRLHYSPRGPHDKTPDSFLLPQPSKNITGFRAEFGYGKYLIVPFWYASAAYQARRLV